MWCREALWLDGAVKALSVCKACWLSAHALWMWDVVAGHGRQLTSRWSVGVQCRPSAVGVWCFDCWMHVSSFTCPSSPTGGFFLPQLNPKGCLNGDTQKMNLEANHLPM